MFNNLSLSSTFRLKVGANKIFVERCNKYSKLFSPLFDIQEGDKLGKYDNEYYLQKNGYFQTISRWYWSENRDKTFQDLDTDFSEFFHFCDELKIDKCKGWTNNTTVIDNMLILINKLIPGLYELKKTYNGLETNNNKLCIKIDSIILTLIDFKTEINRPVQKNRPSHRKLSF